MLYKIDNTCSQVPCGSYDKALFLEEVKSIRVKHPVFRRKMGEKWRSGNGNIMGPLRTYNLQIKNVGEDFTRSCYVKIVAAVCDSAKKKKKKHPSTFSPFFFFLNSPKIKKGSQLKSVLIWRICQDQIVKLHFRRSVGLDGDELRWWECPSKDFD